MSSRAIAGAAAPLFHLLRNFHESIRPHLLPRSLKHIIAVSDYTCVFSLYFCTFEVGMLFFFIRIGRSFRIITLPGVHRKNLGSAHTVAANHTLTK